MAAGAQPAQELSSQEIVADLQALVGSLPPQLPGWLPPGRLQPALLCLTSGMSQRAAAEAAGMTEYAVWSAVKLLLYRLDLHSLAQPGSALQRAMEAALPALAPWPTASERWLRAVELMQPRVPTGLEPVLAELRLAADSLPGGSGALAVFPLWLTAARLAAALMCVVYGFTQQRAADLFGCPYQATVQYAVDFLNRNLLGKLQAALELAAPLREAAEKAAKEAAAAAADEESARQRLQRGAVLLHAHRRAQAQKLEGQQAEAQLAEVDCVCASLAVAASGGVEKLRACMIEPVIAGAFEHMLFSTTQPAAAAAFGAEVSGVAWAGHHLRKQLGEALAPAMQLALPMRQAAEAAAAAAVQAASLQRFEPAVAQLLPRLPAGYEQVAARLQAFLAGTLPALDEQFNADQLAAALKHLLTVSTRQAAADEFGAVNNTVGWVVQQLRDRMPKELRRLDRLAAPMKNAAKAAAKAAEQSASDQRFQAAVELAVPRLPEGRQWQCVAAQLQAFAAGKLPVLQEALVPPRVAAALLSDLTGMQQGAAGQLFDVTEQQVWNSLAQMHELRRVLAPVVKQAEKLWAQTPIPGGGRAC